MPKIKKTKAIMSYKRSRKKKKTTQACKFNLLPEKNNRRIGSLFERLVALQARLRAPGGCPWDREQTHESLRTYLIEEAYEVLDALESHDAEKFAGELGDLLLQVIFHAELAADAGRFDIGDVIVHVHNKMVRRHPHVFGTVKAENSAQVLKNWEELKKDERRTEQEKLSGKPNVGEASPVAVASVLDAVPRKLPALLEAHQMTRRASNVGFDWQDVRGVLEKLNEEASELREAINRQDRSDMEGEVGDVLFVAVNLARFLGFDAEIALKKANRKFDRRFREMERVAAVSRRNLSEMSPERLEELWSEAKQKTAGRA